MDKKWSGSFEQFSEAAKNTSITVDKFFEATAEVMAEETLKGAP